MWTFETFPLNVWRREILWATTVLNAFLNRWIGVSLCFALISLSLQLLCIKLVPVPSFANRRLVLALLLRLSVTLLVFILTASMSSEEYVYLQESIMILQQCEQIMHEISLRFNQGNQQQQGQNVAQAQAPACAA